MILCLSVCNRCQIVIETEISRKWNESEICENRVKWNGSEIKIWNFSENEMKLKLRSCESEIREKQDFLKVHNILFRNN
jgi:hypothetical protein